MSGYDFRALSDHDFEALARDLLAGELGVDLEIFAPGRDAGIDLRHLGADTTVLQCKHYVNSGFNKLTSSLRTERSKVQGLQPDRYGIVTSVALTPDRKQKIIDVLDPFIRRPGDIWGQDDLNALLRKYPAVERAHFKLWLTSTAVMSAVFNHEIVGRSDDLLADIKRKVSLYVQNDSFTDARAILDDHRVCIISGEPGIGKTTLAEMLLVDYISRDYQAVVVSEDVSEAERVYDMDTRQIFYYDDFLGQASTAEKLGKNEDSRLASFMSRVARTNNKRFILTTREYILQEARIQYERLFHSDIPLYKYVLDLASYSRLQRAKILYNHLYFSSLESDAIESVVRDRRYIRLIDHHNYSPRLIEHVVRLGPASARGDHFFEFALETLDRPERLWRHAFEYQLDEHARSVLLVMVSLPGIVFVESVRQAVRQFHGPAADHPSFDRSLKILEGTFTRTRLGPSGMTVVLRNPSVRDFLLAYLDEFPDLAVRLLLSAPFFDQCEYLLRLAFGDPTDKWEPQRKVGSATLRSKFNEHRRNISEAISRTFAGPGSGTKVTQLFGDRSYPVFVPRSVDYEARALSLFTLPDAMLAEDWVVPTFAFLAGRWAENEGSKPSLIKLATAIATRGGPVQSAAAPYFEPAQTWLLGELNDPRDYIYARQLGITMPALVDVAEVARLEAEFHDYLDDLLENIWDEDAEDFVDTVRAAREAADEFGLNNSRLAAAEERASELDRGDDDDDSAGYDVYKDAQREQDLVEYEIDGLFSFLR